MMVPGRLGRAFAGRDDRRQVRTRPPGQGQGPVVLMDATSPTSVAYMRSAIPQAATGRAAQLRAQSLAVTEGQNPEKLTIPDRKALSAGSIPVGLIQHGKQHLTAVPENGSSLEQS